MGQIESLGDRARKMRNNPTEPEKRLWRSLSNSQLGYKIRRQSVIGGFIVDFLCPAKALVIEIDGDTHDAEADTLRDAHLEKLGYRTIRFTNSDVMSNIGGVLGLIAETLAALPDRWPHPNPSPKGEGLADLE
ncbi:endonuclease domain-containing protein [Rhizorhabdus phycosphaerae]|uniref:endonuclease domain-containing protein n=1 Tax=Rhizorhabdus phycosphaerae TaxID=2711156 RepID=UPI0031EB87E4